MCKKSVFCLSHLVLNEELLDGRTDLRCTGQKILVRKSCMKIFEAERVPVHVDGVNEPKDDFARSLKVNKLVVALVPFQMPLKQMSKANFRVA